MKTIPCSRARTRLTHPDGNFFTYQYDPADRLTGILEGATTSLLSIAYDNFGRRSSLARTGADSTSYNYDGLSRLTSLSHDLAGTANDQALTFAYNPASQIATRTGSNDSYAWTAHVAGETATTVNGLNQIATKAGTAFTYDANGNLTSDGTFTYGYDVENRLIDVDWAAGHLNLRYDTLGRLWRVSGDPFADADFVHDGDQPALEYRVNDGNVRYRFVNGPGADEPLIQYDGATLATKRHLHADHQGSVIALTDAAGASIATNRYDEYGVPQPTNSGRIGYTGQMWFKEFGLNHYKARWLDPKLGRFLQTDPVGYDDQINLYAYVGNDPMNLVDPGGDRPLTAGEVKMLQNVFGNRIRLLPVFNAPFLPRSVTTPWGIGFSEGRYAENFSRGIGMVDRAQKATFWHEFYHVFEMTYGIKNWSTMALAHAAANSPNTVVPPGVLGRQLYDWQPGKPFAQQSFEARAKEFSNCMSAGACSNLEGMRMHGGGVSLSFKGGQFTLTQSVPGSRILRVTHFKPDCVEKGNCN